MVTVALRTCLWTVGFHRALSWAHIYLIFMCFLSAKSFQNIKYNYADNTHLYMSVSPDDVNPVETLTLLKDINTWMNRSVNPVVAFFFFFNCSCIVIFTVFILYILLYFDGNLNWHFFTILLSYCVILLVNWLIFMACLCIILVAVRAR